MNVRGPHGYGHIWVVLGLCGFGGVLVWAGWAALTQLLTGGS